MQYEIHFWPSLEQGGAHVFRCETPNVQMAYVWFADTFPSGLIHGSREGFAKYDEAVSIYNYSEIKKSAPPRKPNFRERNEARKANKK